MKIEDVQKIANLARLNLTEVEARPLAAELTAILQFAETLNTLDLKGIEPTAHAVSIGNVFRDDAVHPSDVVSTTLQQSPDHDGPFFLVPKVLG